MARWRLIEPHYLYTQDKTLWEYMETDRTTLRQKRVQFEVPRYIHHEDQTEWTEREGDTGYVVVSNGYDPKHPSDLVFRGEPTPGMLALDDEARAISGKYKWKARDDFGNPNEPDWASRQMDAYVEQQHKINMKLAEAAVQPANGMAEFMQVMTNIMKQNQEILMKISAKDLGLKPIEDTLEPLPPVVEEKRVGRRM